MSTQTLTRTRPELLQQVHRTSGIVLAVFIGIHLLNHLCAVAGPDVHISVMKALREVYRHPLVEIPLLLAVAIQLVSGSTLAFQKKFRRTHYFNKMQVLSGLYLVFFLLVHLGAVFMGRYSWHVETDFYFAAWGPSHYPSNLFFIPYYSLSIISVFVHLACVHRSKVLESQGESQANRTAWVIIGTGVLLAAIILFVFSGGLFPIG